MNKEGKSNKKNYIAVFIVLVAALIFVFYLLNLAKPEKKAKPMTTQSTTTGVVSENDVTSQVVVDNNSSNTETKTPVVIEEISSFSASLYDIISNLSFYSNYDLTTYYHGVEFNFKCTNYDANTDKCHEGSALMKENNVLYPLFTYSNDNDNYFNNGKDFYIYFGDDLVVLVNNYVGVYVGNARFFDRNGSSLGSVSNVITGYKYGDNLFRGLYPNIEDNRFYYYSCNNGSVNISSVGIGNYKDLVIEEAIDGTCNY